jgi:hypothetical protein
MERWRPAVIRLGLQKGQTETRRTFLSNPTLNMGQEQPFCFGEPVV